jgi:hypothetical protein
LVGQRRRRSDIEEKAGAFRDDAYLFFPCQRQKQMRAVLLKEAGAILAWTFWFYPPQTKP